MVILGVIGVFLVLLAAAISGPDPSESTTETDHGQALSGFDFAVRIGLEPLPNDDNEHAPPATGPYPSGPGQSAWPDHLNPSAPSDRDAGIWGEPAQFAPIDPVN